MPTRKAKSARKSALVELGHRLKHLRPGTKRCGKKDLMKIAKMSSGQLAFYEDTGLIGPAFREYSKSRPLRPAVFYSEKDVLKALIITDMHEAGFTTHQLRAAISNLEDMGFRFDASSHLLTNGESVYVAATPDAVIDILKRNRQMLLLVSIQDQIKRVPAPKSA